VSEPPEHAGGEPARASAEPAFRHEPVLLEECRTFLNLPPGAAVLDATLGLGGHAEMLLRTVGTGGRLVGLDRDPQALALARERLARLLTELGGPPGAVTLAHANFQDLGRVLDTLAVPPLDGCLFDLGVSSLQFDAAERGFSFRNAGPLDMRMDPTQGEPARTLLQRLSESELAALLAELGEERYARRIARQIVARRPNRLESTADLEAAVWDAYPAGERHGRIHPATRTFQALRIAVNRELDALEPALLAAVEHLAPGGRLVVLTYHSLEERIVKQTLGFCAGVCRCPPELPACRCDAVQLVRWVIRRPLSPTPQEVERNPRSRSARLRAVERLCESPE